MRKDPVARLCEFPVQPPPFTYKKIDYHMDLTRHEREMGTRRGCSSDAVPTQREPAQGLCGTPHTRAPSASPWVRGDTGAREDKKEPQRIEAPTPHTTQSLLPQHLLSPLMAGARLKGVSSRPCGPPRRSGGVVASPWLMHSAPLPAAGGRHYTLSPCPALARLLLPFPPSKIAPRHTSARGLLTLRFFGTPGGPGARHSPRHRSHPRLLSFRERANEQVFIGWGRGRVCGARAAHFPTPVRAAPHTCPPPRQPLATLLNTMFAWVGSTLRLQEANRPGIAACRRDQAPSSHSRSDTDSWPRMDSSKRFLNVCRFTQIYAYQSQSNSSPIANLNHAEERRRR